MTMMNGLLQGVIREIRGIGLIRYRGENKRNGEKSGG
jgi:hypothetical protein